MLLPKQKQVSLLATTKPLIWILQVLTIIAVANLIHWITDYSITKILCVIIIALLVDMAIDIDGLGKPLRKARKELDEREKNCKL